MKKSIAALAIVFPLFIFKYAHAADDCTTRRANIERELHIAQQYNNLSKISGLNEALNEVISHCTPESVLEEKQHHIQKLQQKINEKNDDIRELTNDLHHAEAKDDRTKAAKIWRKLDKKQDELREAQQKLDAVLWNKNS